MREKTPFLKIGALKAFTMAALSTVSVLSAQTFDLSFANSTVNPTENPPNTIIGDKYTTATSITFTNVAPTSGLTLDLRVTATSWGSRYSYLGSFPNYKKANGGAEPNGDLGYYYQYNGGTSSTASFIGGMNYKLEFLVGGTNEAFVVPDFRLLIYDVDGEEPQSESVRTFLSDGFYGYRIPETGVTVKAEPNEAGANSYLFTGPGADVAEDDSSGAFVLFFHDTSWITLQMESNTKRGGQSANGVFSAIDGDLSLVGGNLDDFKDMKTVPEPGSLGLVALGLGIAALRSRRRRA